MDDLYNFDVPDVSVPAGLHPVVVTSIERREGPKAPYLALQFTVVGGGVGEGETLFYNISLSDKPFARRRARRDMEALIGRVLTAKESLTALIAEMDGKPCKAVVKLGEYMGEQRPEIDRLLPAGEFAGATAADKDTIPF